MTGKALRKWLAISLAAVALSALIWKAWQPKPVKVELAQVSRGPMEETIDEDGETRAHDRFVVSAPVAGRLARIEVHEGDRVRVNQPVALIYPTPLDPLSRKEVDEKLQAARAAERQAQALIARADATLQQAQRDETRAEFLASKGDIPKQAWEKAQLARVAASKELAASQSQAEAAAADVRAVQAAIESQQVSTSRPVAVHTPVEGRVMRIPEKSERVVRAGEGLLTLGDPGRLEIVVDVLSKEAVRIRPGAPARLVDWGGATPIRARVRLVEPSAFRKVSALGIEEQRVNVVLDFVDSPRQLGDAYRVEAQIVVWSSASVLKTAASALFHCGGENDWCAFVARDGRAVRKQVSAGHITAIDAEILGGLEPGERVVAHPPNALTDGAAIEAFIR